MIRKAMDHRIPEVINHRTLEAKREEKDLKCEKNLVPTNLSNLNNQTRKKKMKLGDKSALSEPEVLDNSLLKEFI